jgi:hypothetical protein
MIVTSAAADDNAILPDPTLACLTFPMATALVPLAPSGTDK